MDELIKKARELVSNKYGRAFAEKATDEFCLSLNSKAYLKASAFREDMAASSSTQSNIIIEFSSESTALKDDLNIRQTEAWRKFKEAVAEVNKPFNELYLNAEQVFQQNKIKSYREKILKSINSVNANIERTIEGLYAQKRASLQNQSSLTEICWLNQTVRTIADPIILSDMAADESIKQLDIPRKLQPDISDTGASLAATNYRHHFSRTGKGIIVAVIDSEVLLRHPAFGNRVVHRQNFTKEPWGNPDSHGTAVAGIIASDDAKYSGMAPEATIYNYKVLAKNSYLNADDFQGALAIQQALEDGAHIANCSWGAGPARDGRSREARACDAAWALGLTIVKSAGNNGPGSSTLTTPADAAGVIVVGATGKDSRLVEDYSSRGPTLSGLDRPHLLAPGGSIGNEIFSCLVSGGFNSVGRGTSFAAPHVSGLLALILEGQDLSPDGQRDLVLQLCTKLDGFGVNDQGKGTISMSSLLSQINI